jgi:hypothetical protein
VIEHKARNKATGRPSPPSVSQPDTRATISRALVEWLGFEVRTVKPLTDAEKRQRLEERIVAKFGPAGLELVEELRR